MSTTHGQRDDEAPVKADVAVIGSGTSVRLSLILSILIPSAAAAGYWAANVSSSLKTLVAGQTEMRDSIKGYDGRLTALEKMVNDFKLTGSPQVQRLAERMSILEHDLEMHRVTDEKRANPK